MIRRSDGRFPPLLRDRKDFSGTFPGKVSGTRWRLLRFPAEEIHLISGRAFPDRGHREGPDRAGLSIPVPFGEWERGGLRLGGGIGRISESGGIFRFFFRHAGTYERDQSLHFPIIITVQRVFPAHLLS